MRITRAQALRVAEIAAGADDPVWLSEARHVETGRVLPGSVEVRVGLLARRVDRHGRVRKEWWMRWAP